MSGSARRAGVVPACLSFFAIYNPTLSKSNDALHDQIVYYYSKEVFERNKHGGSDDTETVESHDELNKRQRQIGLAQGMVQFAREFSNGKPIDSIETEKSRIILHNLEKDWWLLASIDLTRLPSSTESQAKSTSQKGGISIEYSAREVSLPALLLQQILRAHQIFLLHQAPTITELWTRVPRQKFCGYLKRFWDDFISNWDVLLHGNPAVEIYNGLKLSAGGELGIGVGEEDWGSGEREVLEGFIGRTEGLVDLTVSRFDDAPRWENDPTRTSPLNKSATTNAKQNGSWEYPAPSDGVIFSGIGALTRPSIRNISSWVEWLHMYGDDSYGVQDNPSSVPRRKRRKGVQDGKESSQSSRASQRAGSPHLPVVNDAQSGIPASIVAPKRPSTSSVPSYIGANGKSGHGSIFRPAAAGDSTGGTEAYMKYLTLGVYGSSWGIPSGRPPVNHRVSSLHGEEDAQPSKPQPFGSGNSLSEQELQLANSCFLIGLLGDLEEDIQAENENPPTEPDIASEGDLEARGFNSRIIMRTLNVERFKSKWSDSKEGSPENNSAFDQVYFDRLRVVVYVQRPFIFTFFFEMQTDALAMPSFYRSLHHQLGPLRRPLLASTSPSKVSERLWEAASPKSTAPTHSSQPISDLVYDPARMTVHTTIPNIPEPGAVPADSAASWTRIEAMSVHSQMLNIYASSRRRTSELERTCKSSRGWWVVWMRLPYPPPTSNTHGDGHREAFLIRRSSDYVSPAARKTSGMFGREIIGSSPSGGWGPGRLAEGIGIDARQYIEGLLSLNR